MININLSILMLITTSIILLATLLYKRITLLEGVITVLISNIILVLIWTVSINVMINDQYVELYSITNIEKLVETETKTKDCNCTAGKCKQCKYTQYTYTFIGYTQDDKFEIHKKVSNIKQSETPLWIIKKYSNNKIYQKNIPFRNVYDNLGQYGNSKFDESFNVEQLVINKTGIEYDINQDLLKLSIEYKYNVVVVLTDNNISNIDILNHWKGLQLNTILIHLITDEENISVGSIDTWGGNTQNERFNSILYEELSYIELKDPQAFMETLYQYIKIFVLPDDTLYNGYIQQIKPNAWVIFGILILSISITLLVLFLMLKYRQPENELQ